MIGFYNYTVYLTYLGMLSAFGGMIFAVNDNLFAAFICMLVSGFCDMIDGKVASTRKRTPIEKKFGVEIDSLSDIISFGVAPALIVSHMYGYKPTGMIVPAMYLLCALIRLAYFNVIQETEEAEQREPGFIGVPVTTAALLFPAIYGLFRTHYKLIMLPAMAVLAILFITPIRIKKPNTVGKIIMTIIGLAILTCILMGGII